VGKIYVSSVNGGFDIQSTMIGMSNLVEIIPFNLTFSTNLSQQLEDLMINATVSLISFPPIPKNATVDGVNVISPFAREFTQATIVTYPSRYSYSRAMLWEIYAAALVGSALCIFLGCYMLFNNGVGADMTFSQVLVTTRNPTLDTLCTGACLGGEYITEELRRVEVKFGELSGEGHPCFGLSREIIPLKKGYTGVSNND
jgi:hypothetical protein